MSFMDDPLSKLHFPKDLCRQLCFLVVKHTPVKMTQPLKRVVIFVLMIIWNFLCLRHYGNFSETSYVFGNRDRVNLNYTLYSCSLQIYNVQPSDAGYYFGKMSRLLPFEESFHVSDRQHTHSSDVDANYGKFRVHVRIPVSKEIRIEPKVVNEQVLVDIVQPYLIISLFIHFFASWVFKRL